LCGKQADGTALANPITKTGATFNTLCSLLDSGPWSTPSGTVNLVDFLGNGVNNHTIFAPDDAAFAKIQNVVNGVLALQSIDPTQFNSIVLNWLSLHILPDTYLTSDLTCDKTYITVDLSRTLRFPQKQKTKCRGQANFFAQIGGGNVGESDQPTVGLPGNVFPLTNFQNSAGNTYQIATNQGSTGYSSNVISCNGVIHVVDAVLQPGNPDPYYGYYYYGGKGAKGAKGGYYAFGSRGGYGSKGGYYVYRPYYGRRLGSFELDVLNAGKASKAARQGHGFFRQLLQETTGSSDNRKTSQENRRARLEALLIDANGNSEPFD